jgi:glycosyltransferase involved in cell wall biosynthesis
MPVANFVYPSSSQRTGGVIVLYELANELCRRGYDVHFLHGPASPHRVKSLDELPAFSFEPAIAHHLVDDLADDEAPDGDLVFHADAPARLGLPVVVVQGYGMLSRAWEDTAFRTPAPKVCVARWLVDVGRELGVPEEQLWHVPLGLDHDTFHPDDSAHERPIDVAMLSHPFPQKGWAVGRDCLELLSAERDLAAVVFGATSPEPPAPPGTRVLIGPDHPTLASEVYGRTKVFVQPSLVEGFGYTPVEAMACGAALVTTDNGGSRDYADDERTALVVPSGDAGALAAAVRRLLDDDVLRLRLAEAGRARAAGFRWERTGATLDANLRAYLADPEHYRRAPADPVQERV